jgi:uncharacterized membrane protein
MITLGIRLYALGAVALGLVGLWWGDFALQWQPVPPGVPGRTALAYVCAAALALAGAALNLRRTARAGAAVLSAVFLLIVVLLHGPLVAAHPLVVGAWNGLAEQLALLSGAWLAFTMTCGADGAPHRLRRAQLAFGACLITFGLAHFYYLDFTASLVPKWIPPGQLFWAAATGVAHLAAGVAILTRVRAYLAAVLLTVMFVLFGLLVHAPLLLADPRSHLNWVMNAMNLALTGAAWVVADSLAPGRVPLGGDVGRPGASRSAELAGARHDQARSAVLR